MTMMLIQYQTHYVLTNKKSLTEMNKLRKIETPHPQQHRVHTKTKTKSEFRKFKENYE